MSPAPIALFVYNRLAHTQRTLAALQQNELAPQTELFVFSDGPRNPEDSPRVDAVRQWLDGVRGFKSITVVKQARNLGLAQSIISGVTQVCQRFGRAIVVEDDLLTSPHFLRYMNDGLALYENCLEVISIHGYVYPVKGTPPETFFLKGADCWGWATWQRGWEIFNPAGESLLAELERRNLCAQFDFNGSFGYTEMLRQQIAGTNDSWAIRWYASAFLQDKLTLYPGRSLVQNIGFDASGRHCGQTDSYQVPLTDRPVRVERQSFVEAPGVRQEFEAYFLSLKRPSFFRRLRNWLWRG